MSTAAAAKRSISHERYHRSDYLFSQPDVKIGSAGLLENVVICRVGPAKSYGTNLDQSFIDEVVRLGSSYSQGLKCRFGHPNMSTTALGTFLGRLKNFRVDGDKARADLQLDDISKKAPGGNLYEYVVEMAAKNQDMFGMSIVFEPGKSYFLDDAGEKTNGYPDDDRPIYESIKELFACDCVDDPAATDSFFSKEFNKGAFAVQLTEFLDEHEEVFEFFIANPASLDTFMKRYKDYREKKNPEAMKNKTVQLSAKAQLAMKKLGKKFDVTANTTTGDEIHIITAGTDPAVGDQVNIVAPDGNESPAPDDTYVINGGAYDGWTCVVANGAITEITNADTIAPDTTPANTVQNEKITKLEQKVDELNKKLSETPAAVETIIAEGGDESFLSAEEEKLSSWNKEGMKIFNRNKKLKEQGAFNNVEEVA